MKISFADNLRMWRIEKNWTQLYVATKLHTTQRKVSYWEKGSTEPDLESLCALADLFEVTTDELLGRE